jgi:hypothetical protein
MSDDAPKSAFELAMERLRKKDQESGEKEPSVTNAQRTALAEIRRTYEAKLAEREILHMADLRKAPDPEARAALDEQYQRERERIFSERDSKLEAVRTRRKKKA